VSPELELALRVAARIYGSERLERMRRAVRARL